MIEAEALVAAVRLGGFCAPPSPAGAAVLPPRSVTAVERVALAVQSGEVLGLV
ncbi:MAG: hypothetical protein M5U08_13940 [Burkholderiales bacterium]|nr:hypothetical protein [Burkholderiales bacterium]